MRICSIRVGPGHVASSPVPPMSSRRSSWMTQRWPRRPGARGSRYCGPTSARSHACGTATSSAGKPASSGEVSARRWENWWSASRMRSSPCTSAIRRWAKPSRTASAISGSVALPREAASTGSKSVMTSATPGAIANWTKAFTWARSGSSSRQTAWESHDHEHRNEAALPETGGPYPTEDTNDRDAPTGKRRGSGPGRGDVGQSHRRQARQGVRPASPEPQGSRNISFSPRQRFFWRGRFRWRWCQRVATRRPGHGVGAYRQEGWCACHAPDGGRPPGEAGGGRPWFEGTGGVSLYFYYALAGTTRRGHQ